MLLTELFRGMEIVRYPGFSLYILEEYHVSTQELGTFLLTSTKELYFEMFSENILKNP